MTSDGVDSPISREQLLIDFVNELTKKYRSVSISFRKDWCLRVDDDESTPLGQGRRCFVGVAKNILDLPDALLASMVGKAEEIRMINNQAQPIRRLPPKEIKKSLFGE